MQKGKYYARDPYMEFVQPAYPDHARCIMIEYESGLNRGLEPMSTRA